MIRKSGWAATMLVIGLATWIGVDLILRGAGSLHFRYLIEPPSNLGRAGGIGPLLFSTAAVVLPATVLASIVSLPLAILYSEMRPGSATRKWIRILLDIGVGVPRIIWGLFGGVVFVGWLGLGFSLAAGILTLACLLAPILVTGFISGIEAVDPQIREQCAALGVSRWRVAWRQVLPAARPGLVAAMALGLGRGCGDAAALYFTAGVAMEMPRALSDSGATLAVFIFHLLSTVPGGQPAAYAAASVLFLVALLIQVLISFSNRSDRFAM